MKKILTIPLILLTIFVSSQTRRSGSLIYAEDSTVTFSSNAYEGTIVFENQTNQFYKINSYTPSGTVFYLASRTKITSPPDRTGSGGSSIYTSDGLLTENRVVDLNANSLTFQGSVKVSDTLNVEEVVKTKMIMSPNSRVKVRLDTLSFSVATGDFSTDPSVSYLSISPLLSGFSLFKSTFSKAGYFYMYNNDTEDITTLNIPNYPSILGSQKARLKQNVANSIILGGANITAKSDNTAYVNQIGLNSGEDFETLLSHTAATQENNLVFPNKSGTIATLADAFSLYKSDGTVPSNTVATLIDNLTFSDGKTTFKGSGVTSGTLTAEFKNSSGTSSVKIYDDGRVDFGTKFYIDHPSYGATIAIPNSATDTYRYRFDTDDGAHRLSKSGVMDFGGYAQIPAAAANLWVTNKGANNRILRLDGSDGEMVTFYRTGGVNFLTGGTTGASFTVGSSFIGPLADDGTLRIIQNGSMNPFSIHRSDNLNETFLCLDSVGKFIFNGGDLTTADFQMKGSADANLFYLDASVDAVGFGIATPLEKVHSSAKVRADTGFNYNGNNGITQVLNFGGVVNGDVATLTIEGGIITAVTYVEN